MQLFGWRNVFKRDIKEEESLIEQLRDVSSRSKANQKRLDRIIDIEKVRLRNLELRAEVLSRTRIP